MGICEFIDCCGGAASPLAFLGQVEDHAVEAAFVWDCGFRTDFGVGVLTCEYLLSEFSPGDELASASLDPVCVQSN